jgi:hypothetical protein
MLTRPRVACSRWVALAATWGTLLAAMGLPGDRGCVADDCCASGPDDCCYRPASDQRLSPTPCQCRKGEPVAPAPKPDRTTPDASPGPAVDGLTFGPPPHAAPLAAYEAAHRPRAPLHILTTHLRC